MLNTKKFDTTVCFGILEYDSFYDEWAAGIICFLASDGDDWDWGPVFTDGDGGYREDGIPGSYDYDKAEPLGGGGGTHDTKNPPIESTKDVNKITAKNSLNAKETEQLNKALSDMLKECGYRKMYDYIGNIGFKMNDIKIDPKITVGGYYPPTRTMTFNRGDLIYQSLPEEFIHFFQDAYYKGGISQYTEQNNNFGRANIEFEAKLVQDILCWLSGKMCDYYGAGVKYDAKYIDWIINLTNNGSSFPSFSDMEKRKPELGYLNYWDFMEDFRSSKPEYNYPVNKYLEPSVLIFLSNTNCN